MIAFAALLERLLFAPRPDIQVTLLRDYFATQPDPDRGFALAALIGALPFPAVRPTVIRALAAERIDPTLFALSHDYVGDLVETVALTWPAYARNAPPPRLSEVMHTLSAAPATDVPRIVAAWLDTCDASTRHNLLKLIARAPRPELSARLIREALAGLADPPQAPHRLEEIWHGLTCPYEPLFAWLEGRAAKPDPGDAPVFRPLMLAQPLVVGDIAPLEAELYRAEWKWDGIRVQLVSTNAGRRLYARGAEDISAAFPEIIAAMDRPAVLDGALLVIRDGVVAPFADVRQRLHRKTVSARIRRDYPVAVRLHDMLFDDIEDIRPLQFDARRARLEAWFARHAPTRMDLSPLIPFTSLDDLNKRRLHARIPGIGGLMLKRADSPYEAGRPRGPWWKWKHDPLQVNAVLMYAQRGRGQYGGAFVNLTFGVWHAGELVPVGKTCGEITGKDGATLDRWLQTNTIARFGPVHEVAKKLVLEVEFESVQRSSRHKAGLTLRHPQIGRIRADKPAVAADHLESLLALTEASPSSSSARPA